MSVLLVLAVSGLRWFTAFSSWINPFPLLLFFLLPKKEKYGFLVLGGLAGLAALLVSYGPGLFWILQYVFESWLISNLFALTERSGFNRYLLVWIAVGIDFGVWLLIRKLLEYPVHTTLIKDWLMMDGVTGFLGMLVVFVEQFLRWTDGHASRKQHGIGIPLS